MSLTSALSAAGAGLSTISRRAESISGNIANADNPNYARRDVALTTDGHGAPTISLIERAVDSALDAMYRTEVSRTATQDAVATGLTSYTAVLGDSQSTDTILTRMTDFQNALSLLSVSPSDSSLQRSTVYEAQGLAQALNRAGEVLNATSQGAAAAIQSDVAIVNSTMTRLQALNDRFVSSDQGEGRLALEDQITAELDVLAEVMDFTMRTDTGGRIELFTTGGTELLVGNKAQPLRFDPATGTLFSGTTDITPDKPGARGISEGALAGRIGLYSETLPVMQAQLDEVARALIEGMAAVDPSLADGEAGLFTDAGAALDDPFPVGLASRIAVNDAVVAEQGGAHWRVRDGIGAAEPGLSGDNALIEAFETVLSATTGFDAGAGLGGSDTLPNYVASLIASQNTVRASAESTAGSFAAGAVAVQSTRMSFSGVNLDDELQQLAAVQQSYAANAKVLTVASEMIDTLLRIA